MKYYWLLLAVFTVGSVLSLHVDEGCEAKSEWRLDYQWDEVKIRFWVPSEERSIILSIVVEFEDQIHPVTYDNFEIYRKELHHTRIREGDRTSTTFKILNEITDGWNHLDFTLNSQYGLKDMLNNFVSSLNSSVDYLPKYLSISGRYITVNCPLKLRMWKITDEPVTVPFDASENQLSFYSNRKFLPEMDLYMRQFLLGWDNSRNALTTIPTRAMLLPSFVQHHLVITCRREEETICSLEVVIGDARTLTEELRVEDTPKSITIKRKDGDSFWIFVHERDEQEKGNKTSRAIVGRSWTFILLVVGVVSFLIIIFTVIFTAIGNPFKAYVRKLLNKTNSRKIDLENNQNTHEEISCYVTSSGSDETCIK